MSNNHEILALLEYYEKEKQISRADMIEIIATAIKNAAARKGNAGQELKIEINPRSGAITSYQVLEVTDSVGDHQTEIHIEKAKLHDENAQIGEYIYREVDLGNVLGRIDIKNIQQLMTQKLRNTEKERIFDDYKDQIGDIVSGVVRRRERGNLIVDLGKAEALMPRRESIPTEDYGNGERIRCLLLEIENTTRGNEIILSRASQKFIRRLFEIEVTEIGEGSVSLDAIAREAGYRTKIAVSSTDPKIDPVGACVGASGSRVKNIVRELNGEKVDVIKYNADPKLFLEECVKPAQVKNLKIDQETRTIYFEVSEEDLSLVIGKRGSNAKLTSRLLGWKLDIHKEEIEDHSLASKLQKAAGSLSQVLSDLTEYQVAILANNGINSLEAFEGVEAFDLVEMGFSPVEASSILEKVSDYLA
ncbi:MAG: transcription termination factor NusA [Opitutales bacterium]